MCVSSMYHKSCPDCAIFQIFWFLSTSNFFKRFWVLHKIRLDYIYTFMSEERKSHVFEKTWRLVNGYWIKLFDWTISLILDQDTGTEKLTTTTKQSQTYLLGRLYVCVHVWMRTYYFWVKIKNYPSMCNWTTKSLQRPV